MPVCVAASISSAPYPEQQPHDLHDQLVDRVGHRDQGRRGRRRHSEAQDVRQAEGYHSHVSDHREGVRQIGERRMSALPIRGTALLAMSSSTVSIRFLVTGPVSLHTCPPTLPDGIARSPTMTRSSREEERGTARAPSPSGPLAGLSAQERIPADAHELRADLRDLAGVLA
jgi:hypothetical protein